MKKFVLTCCLIQLATGCAFFKKSNRPFDLERCPDDSRSFIYKGAESAIAESVKCLRTHNRNDEADRIEGLLKTRIKIRCDLTDSVFYVLADKNSGGLNVNPGKFISDTDGQKLKSEIFHESIHLLGFPHGSGFDLSTLADNCCRPIPVKHSGDLQKRSCDLLKMKNSDWLSSEYLKEYAIVANSIGKRGYVIKTFLAAAQNLRKSAKADQIFNLALAPLENLNQDALKKKFNRKDRQKFKNDAVLIQSLVFAQLAFKSKTEASIRKAQHIYSTLASRIYPYQADKEKLAYFKNTASLLVSVLLSDSASLSRNWVEFRDRAEYLCRDLTPTENTAIQEVLAGVSLSLFDLKSQIPAGDFYEIATYWSNPCELHNSLKSPEGRSH